MKISKSIKKILLEQSQWEQLSPTEQIDANTRLSVIELRYSRQGCELKKFGTKWFKKCTGTPTPPSSNLDKYVGQYEGESFFPAFNVVIKDGKLYASNDVGDIELTPISDNKFNLKFAGSDFLVNFILSGGSVTGGTATGTYLGILKTFNFTKKSSTPTPSKPDETNSSKPPSVWDCIENYNKENNAKSLYDRDEYRYEKVDLEHDNKPTIFKYYKDGRVDWAYYADQKPILQGKWECRGDNGYIIKWSNGKISTYNVKTGGGLEGESNNTTTTTTLENICPNGYKEGCVSEEDILNKKKALKVCRKCDLVKKVQENPEIKARIFRIQKELGKEQKTDNVFGPIMLAAIKEYQSSHGINPTGAVGEKTLSKINSYINPKVEEPKVNKNEPVINKTDGKNEPVINKTDGKSTNKPQVKPIYRRSSRQVLRPDEEL